MPGDATPGATVGTVRAAGSAQMRAPDPRVVLDDGSTVRSHPFHRLSTRETRCARAGSRAVWTKPCRAPRPPAFLRLQRGTPSRFGSPRLEHRAFSDPMTPRASPSAPASADPSASAHSAASRPRAPFGAGDRSRPALFARNALPARFRPDADPVPPSLRSRITATKAARVCDARTSTSTRASASSSRATSTPADDCARTPWRARTSEFPSTPAIPRTRQARIRPLPPRLPGAAGRGR